MASTGDVLLKIVFFIIALVGITGNILVCLVVLLNKSMRTPMNYLLVNLAISDMLFLAFLNPQFIFETMFDDLTNLSGELLCKFMTVFAWTAGYSSAFSLISIAVERHLAITRPHNINKRITIRSVKFLVAICWSLAFSWNVIGFVVKSYDEKEEKCEGMWPHEHSRKVYHTLSLLIVGLVPVVIMLILYSRVVYTLWFKATNPVSGFSQLAVVKNRKKVTKILLTISILYTVCWLPQSFIYMIRAYDRSLVGSIAYPISAALLSVSSAANPFIYCLHSSRFRTNLKKVIRFDLKRLRLCIRRARIQPVTSRNSNPQMNAEKESKLKDHVPQSSNDRREGIQPINGDHVKQSSNNRREGIQPITRDHVTQSSNDRREGIQPITRDHVTQSSNDRREGIQPITRDHVTQSSNDRRERIQPITRDLDQQSFNNRRERIQPITRDHVTQSSNVRRERIKPITRDHVTQSSNVRRERIQPITRDLDQQSSNDRRERIQPITRDHVTQSSNVRRERIQPMTRDLDQQSFNNRRKKIRHLTRDHVTQSSNGSEETKV